MKINPDAWKSIKPDLQLIRTVWYRKVCPNCWAFDKKISDLIFTTYPEKTSCPGIYSCFRCGFDSSVL